MQEDIIDWQDRNNIDNRKVNRTRKTNEKKKQQQQKTKKNNCIFISSKKLLRRVLVTWGDLMSPKLQWKIINWRWCEEFASNYINNNNLDFEKTVEHAGDNYTSCNWCFWYGKKRIIKGSEGLRSWRTSGDYPNNSIIENGQNTEESSGDSNSSERPSANADVKNSKGINNNNEHK